MTQTKAEGLSEPLLNRFFPHMVTRIEDLRKARGISVEHLSKETGLTKPTVYRLLRGVGNPMLANYARLAEALGTSLTYLLGPQRKKQESEPQTGSLAEALMADPPEGDVRARDIYDAVCKLTPSDEIKQLLTGLNYALPGEKSNAAVSRAILDVYHYGLAWIDDSLLPRDRELEKRIHQQFRLPERSELEERIPVRVIAFDSRLNILVQIHALAAVAAAVVKELLQNYKVLGFADGFAVSTLQRFLRRGDLTKAELVPLTYSPRFVLFELSGATLAGAMNRTHSGYQVGSALDLAKWKDRIEDVEVAVTSCGTALTAEPQSRLARLLFQTRPRKTYDRFLEEMQRKKVVGDLMYHFLRDDGQVVRMGSLSRDLEAARIEHLYPKTKDEPAVYSVSPDRLASIARRGVCLLLIHSPERARLARAAFRRSKRPINFIVTTSEAAKELLKQSRT